MGEPFGNNTPGYDNDFEVPRHQTLKLLIQHINNLGMKNKHSNSTVAGRVPLVIVSLTKRSNKDRPVGTPN